MRPGRTHPQDARWKEDRAKFLSRRLNTVVSINFGFFGGYTFDQFVIPGGNTGIMLAAVFTVFMAFRLYRAESARHST